MDRNSPHPQNKQTNKQESTTAKEVKIILKAFCIHDIDLFWQLIFLNTSISCWTNWP